jgi:hypothetical protein
MIQGYVMPEALKWIFLAFAAGFIGFFGKYLGRIVLARLHKEKGPEANAASPASPRPPAVAAPSLDEKLLKKAEKNRLKAQKKLSKKASEQDGE